MPIFTAPEGIQLQLQSPTGEVLAYLSDTDESGKILNAKVIERKIGGVEKFTFQIANDTDLPITRNTECYFYVSGILRFIGQIVEIPLPDQDDPVLELTGNGFYRNLEKKVINTSYTAQTLDAIVKDVGNNYLGADIDIFYDVDKIDTPNITNIDIEFKDKNLFDVFLKLLQIANHDYDNEKYRFYIDNEKDFVFEQMTETLQTVLFEGFQYQAPEVSEDNSNIINKILTFRTTSADPRTAEYVATYQDTASQGRYGLFEKKITFPDYIDTTTISEIADFILSRRANPQTKIKIENVEIFRPPKKFSDLGVLDAGSGEDDWFLDKDVSTSEQIRLTSDIRRGLQAIDFGNWGISNKRNLFWAIVAECDTLTGWDLTNLSVTTAVLSTTRVLTGRQSIKFTTGSGSDGEYAEYTLTQEIPLALMGRLYVYFENTVDKIRITFYDTFSNEISFEFGTIERTLEVDILLPDTDDLEVDYSGGTDVLDTDIISAITYDQWLKIVQNIELATELDNFFVKPNGAAEQFQVKPNGAAEDFQIRFTSQVGILNVKRIRITMLTNNALSFYLDRIDAYANIYKFHELQLEEIEYNLSSKLFTADLNFGELEDNIIDEIDKKVEEGDIALAIFSKQ